MGSIYFNGSELTSHTVSFNGSEMAKVYFNGVELWAAAGDEPDFTPVATFYSSGTHIEAIDDALSGGTINIQMVGGGAGGCKEYPVDGDAPGAAATDGGTTTVVVKQADGSVRTTFTAAGGAVTGGCNGGGHGGDWVYGLAGDDFTHPGGGADASFAGTGGAGGAWNGTPGDGGTGAGGGGRGKGTGVGSAGAGGGAGTFYTTTYSIVAVTDYLEITVGAGGEGRLTTRDGQAGNGGSGRVRILGIVS